MCMELSFEKFSFEKLRDMQMTQRRRGKTHFVLYSFCFAVDNAEM
jgi:hypothetical protein